VCQADIDIVESLADSRDLHSPFSTELVQDCSEEPGPLGQAADDSEIESVPTEEEGLAPDEEADILDDEDVFGLGGEGPLVESTSPQLATVVDLATAGVLGGAGEHVSALPGAASSSGASGGPEPTIFCGPGSRQTAHLSCVVPGGKITIDLTKNIAEAVCGNPAHGKCVLTRSLSASENVRRYGQGRPLGLLMGWLSKGRVAATKADHWLPGAFPTQAERHQGREALAHIPVGLQMLGCEREKRAGGGGSEPDDVP
jgi:hypothetical protein